MATEIILAEFRTYIYGTFETATERTGIGLHRGNVRKRTTAQQWLALIKREAAVAQSAGQVRAIEPSAPVLAFEIASLLASANIARDLHDDENALHIA
jgi:hypothetical protein